MSRTKLVRVVGARPQFMQAAPLSPLVREHFDELLVHTGQHYERMMSDVFFADLNLPAPDYQLGVGGGPQGAQTGRMLERLEEVFQKERPDGVVVDGDTNSTLAGALAAAKMHIPVFHVESGLRSFNPRMPEEINRVLTDRLASLHFAPGRAAKENLAEQGIVETVHVTGDVLLDCLRLFVPKAETVDLSAIPLAGEGKPFYLATVHRAENTDDPDLLRGLLDGLGRLPLPVVLPLHPRTREAAAALDGFTWPASIHAVEPVSYLAMLALEARAELILTDSGGVQREAYYQRRPCLVLRDRTEWVEVLEGGWCRLLGECVEDLPARAAACRAPDSYENYYGDGHASEAVVEALCEFYR